MKRKGYVLIGLGVVLLFGAFCLLMHNNQLEEHAEEASKAVIPKLEREIKHNKENNLDVVYEQMIKNQNVMKEPLPSVPTVEVNHYTYAGLLSIPSLGLKLPVLEKYRYRDLNVAPCRYYGSTSGHFIIAGHNYRSHFGRLSELKKGDVVYYTDGNGEVLEYRVKVIEEIDANDNETLVKQGWDLSLFTCNYMGDKRVTVRCKKFNP